MLQSGGSIILERFVTGSVAVHVFSSAVFPQYCLERFVIRSVAVPTAYSLVAVLIS